MENSLRPAVDCISQTIGNTPLVRFQRLCPDSPTRVWAKLENFNPGGSAKDRTAAALLEDAIARGNIRPGGTVVESSSGNLGMALARECLLHNINFHCVVDPRTNHFTVSTMEAYGAKVHAVTEPDPKTGDWLAARKTKVQELLAQLPDSLNLNQYANRAAFAAHADGTMREIVQQLGHAPTYLLVAVSTTGTIGGCIQYLRHIGASTQVIAVDAEGSVLYDGHRGSRILPGFGAGVVPELSEFSTPDSIIRVEASHSIAGARLVARREGLLPGASGGAVTAALMSLRNKFTPDDDVVMIFHDQGAAYLHSIYDDEWVGDNVCDVVHLPDLEMES